MKKLWKNDWVKTVSVLLGFIVMLGTIWQTFSSQKSAEVKTENNSGSTQVMVNSPGSSQTMNKKKTILPQYQKNFLERDGAYVLQILLKQSSGIWDAGQKFKIQLQLNGPYMDAKFTKGFGSSLRDVVSDRKTKDGYFYYETMSAPIDDSPIVLEVYSNVLVDIVRLGVEPL